MDGFLSYFVNIVDDVVHIENLSAQRILTDDVIPNGGSLVIRQMIVNICIYELPSINSNNSNFTLMPRFGSKL